MSKLRLVGQSDADFATDPTDRKSVSGGVVNLRSCGGDACVDWLSSKQSLVAQSVHEAEVIGQNTLYKRMLGIRNFIGLAGRAVREAVDFAIPRLESDSASGVLFSMNPTFTKRSKHLQVRYFMVKNAVNDNRLEIDHRSGATNRAPDGFTKHLTAADHARFCEAIGIWAEAQVWDAVRIS